MSFLGLFLCGFDDELSPGRSNEFTGEDRKYLGEEEEEEEDEVREKVGVA